MKTVRKYVAPAEAAGIASGDGLVLDRAGWAARVAEWFPALSDARARSLTWPVLEVLRELIESMLATTWPRVRPSRAAAWVASQTPITTSTASAAGSHRRRRLPARWWPSTAGRIVDRKALPAARRRRR